MTETNAAAPDAMTIHQLVARSGVPARRIRYYTAVGLLPPPIGRGRAAHYRREHLTRLQQIQALRDLNLSLSEIEERLGPAAPVTTGDQVEAVAWQRWEIVPGVEIHVRSDLPPETARLTRALVGVARQLLAGEGGADTK